DSIFYELLPFLGVGMVMKPKANKYKDDYRDQRDCPLHYFPVLTTYSNNPIGQEPACNSDQNRGHPSSMHVGQCFFGPLRAADKGQNEGNDQERFQAFP